MIRPMFPIFGAVLLCAQSFAVLAADSIATGAVSGASSASAEQQVRDKLEAQRAQLSGAASLAKSASQGATTVIDTPVQSDDAPAQVQQP